MIIYFDTETTGLSPGRIIQLSYIIDYGDMVKGKNFFFAVDYIPKESTMVHGFTVEKIYQLSKGKTFSEQVEEIYDDFSIADLVVAHNFPFDLKFLQAEFCYLERQFKYNEYLDTMKYFTDILKLPRRNNVGYKYPKLTELSEFFEIYSIDVSRKVKEIFNEYVLNGHDARFDATEMYLSVKKWINQDKEFKNYISNYIKN